LVDFVKLVLDHLKKDRLENALAFSKKTRQKHSSNATVLGFTNLKRVVVGTGPINVRQPHDSVVQPYGCYPATLRVIDLCIALAGKHFVLRPDA